MKQHDLKCWTEPFEALLRGEKRHEWRADGGRDFETGDALLLREWIPSDEGPGRYTERQILRLVTYVSRGPDWGIPEGFVILSVVEPHAVPVAVGAGLV